MEQRLLSKNGLFLVLGTLGIGIIGARAGLNHVQMIALLAFSFSILGALLFWEFRLSFAFFSSSLILFAGVVSLEEFIRLSTLEVILFLIGMMIIVGFLREIGIFTWFLQRALIMKRLNAKKFMISLVFSSALLSCVVGEVSSILIVIMIIFELCDYFEVNPVPYVLASVLATNVGSAGTVIGNPIGLIIATKAGLTFEDFMKYAFPLMFASLFIVAGLLIFIFRKELKELDEKIKEFGPNEFLIRLLSIPPEKNVKIGFIIFGITLLLMIMHHRIELFLKIGTNTILLMAPLFASSIIMVWRRQKARHYIENDVEWWTLLFFLFLFGQAGVLTDTGVAKVLASKFLSIVSDNKALLISSILFGGGAVSSAVDNVVVVVGSIPIVENLRAILQTHNVLWWALLFGACFGGNITVIGSTANIIAIGALERQRHTSINFFYWFKIGLIVGLATMSFIFLSFLFIPYYK